ncbi:MAG: selenocysteine-specific translation elongation factor [Deltaproteobacteria bacterium]|nr:selenocysteine-specific translation elongation factor [Deltaproteobacteria bacterium]
MKRIIIGTAGHIDHGKTALVKALTGIDCDRLREEKERGITIELGFAALDLGDGRRLGIVDVPGHEKFVKNMVAGVTGIDAVMLIIAADEGVMPQTREHLAICRMLAVQAGCIVLTKSDLVDAEWLEMVAADVRNFVAGSFLEGAPVVAVSAQTGAGLDELRLKLAQIMDGVQERSAKGLCRLPVDRVFSMKGFGTVITGTLQAGTFQTGDEVSIEPGGRRAKIRGLQVHGDTVTSAGAGQRTAINFQGLERECIERGDVVGEPDTLVATKKIALWYEHLPDAERSLKNRAPVRFHAGTAERMGRVVLLEAEEMLPGDTAFVQIVLSAPVVVLPGERFVLRSYSPVATIGGGMILDIQPPKHKRMSEATGARLSVLKDGSISDRIQLYCREAGVRGMEFDALLRRCGRARPELLKVLDGMTARGGITLVAKKPQFFAMPGILDELCGAALAQLKAFHESSPLVPGMRRQELLDRLAPGIDQRLFQRVLDMLAESGAMRVQQEFLSLPAHRPALQQGQQKTRDTVVRLYTAGGRMPPTRREVLESSGVREKELAEILQLLVREGALVRLNDDLYYTAESMRDLSELAALFMQQHGELTIQGFKDQTGLTRKFLIPLFEYFDRIRLTMRMGDKRIPRKTAE